MLNINSKKAIAVKYSSGVYSDHYGACDLLKEVNFQYVIKVLYANRAYDRHRLYKLCKEYDIKAKISPKNGAAEHPKLNYMAERNAAIRLMQRRWNEEVEKANKLRKKILCRDCEVK